ncbi:hypothetical protein GJ744_006984 [Endocarpon pusillum]|uniref:Retrotransposon gag domain-containing protein n=1 Tax=Endocarpon pusillum TaxID=364733 RepID=A0A8H7A6N9_9EURO|nr:hypothetical protein GJ744_006984 [Endocarpon pusillum]
MERRVTRSDTKEVEKARNNTDGMKEDTETRGGRQEHSGSDTRRSLELAIRELIRDAGEDRKQAAEDRKRMEALIQYLIKPSEPPKPPEAPNSPEAANDSRTIAEILERIVERLNPKPPKSSQSPESSNVTIKPSEIYEFKPTSRQDERSARIFIERIQDAKATYQDHIPKLAMALPRCLFNEVAHTWFSALSEADKYDIRTSPDIWINLIKRDFMGTAAQLRYTAGKETFNWDQDRTPAEYVDEKVAKLRVARMTAEEDIVTRVYKGLEPRELRVSMTPYKGGGLRAFSEMLREIQDDHRHIHKTTSRTKESRYSSRN